MTRPFMVHVGNNNFVNASRILTVSGIKGMSIRRTIKAAEEAGLLLDFTGALQTRSIIFLDAGVVIKSPIRTIDIEKRVNLLDNQVG
jgi:regulator of extracellular matrix RemA (YlzA/DUF370 family)